MSTNIGQYVYQQRKALGITPEQLARDMGYRNINKGIRRLQQLETTGHCAEPLWRSIREKLSLDPTEIRTAKGRDAEAHEARRDVPIPIQLFMRIIPGVYARVRLPEDIKGNLGKIEEYAQTVARKKGRRVRMVSPAKQIWFDGNGRWYPPSAKAIKPENS